MLVTTILITLSVLAIIANTRMRKNADTPKLGWMSEAWLAQHRAGRQP